MPFVTEACSIGSSKNRARTTITAEKDERIHVPCYLLHMVEMPESRPYDDPELKDLVGRFPKLFCAYCNPPRELRPSESARCMDRDAPCWRAMDQICE